MRTGGLLVVTSHPDDEVLIAGGTLAACAGAGVPTAVVCLTRGESGPIAHPALATPENLATVRLAELRAACAELGVEWVKCYRREDGNLRWSDGSAIVRQLIRIVEMLRPAAVITFGEDGLYYHPDHIATYELTRRAVKRSDSSPALYRSVWPAGLMAELTSELDRRGLPADLWDLEPDEFGTDELEGIFELDLRAQAGRKLRALRCHRTQIGPGHAFSALPDDLAERYLGVEWFAAVGDTGERTWLPRILGRATTHA